MGWEDSLVNKVLALQAYGPEFNNLLETILQKIK